MAVTAAELLVRVNADTAGLASGMQQAHQQVESFGSKLEKAGATASAVGRKMSLGLTAPIVGFGVAAVKIGMEYDRTMNVLQAATNASDVQMKMLRSTAIALGSDTKLAGTSAKDAGEAMFELAKGGLSASQAAKAARGTLQLAAAAQIGNADAAKIQVRALNAFSLKADQASRVSNVLAAAANASTADIADLAQGFQMAGSAFSSGHQKIEDLAASLAKMSDKGISGSDAGTSLKTMMMRLNPQTKKAKEAMEALGVSAYDSGGRMKPMRQIVGDFTAATADMTDKQKSATLATIFGSDAIRAADIVLTRGTESYDKYTKAVSDRDAAERMSAAQMKGLSGAIENIKSQWETTSIILTEQFKPILTKIANGIGGLIAAFNGLSPTTKKTVVMIALLVAAIGPLLLGMSTLIGIVTALASPVLAVVAVIAALAAAFIILYNHSQTFRNGVQAVIAFLPQLKAAFVGALTAIKAVWDAVWPALAPILKAVFSLIGAQLRSAFGIIKGIVTTVMAVIHGDWGKAWQGIKDTFSAALYGVIASAKIILGQLIPAVLSLAVKAGLAILTGLASGLASLGSWLGGVSTKIVGFFANAGTWLLNAGKEIVGGFLNGLKEKAKDVYKWFTDFTSKIPDWKGPPSKDATLLTNNGRLVMSSFLFGVKEKAGEVISYFQSFGPSLARELSTGIDAGKTQATAKAALMRIAGSDLMKNYILGISSQAPKISGDMGNAVSSAIEAVKSRVSAQQASLSQAFQKVAGNALRAFDAATQTGLDNIQSTLDKKLTAIKDRFKKQADALDTWRDSLTNGEKALAAFDKAQTEAGLQKGLSDANAALAKAQAGNDGVVDPEAVLSAQQQLQDAQNAITRYGLEQQAQIERDARNKAAADRAAALTAQEQTESTNATNAANRLKKNYDSQREAQRLALEGMLTQLDTYLQKHPERWAAVMTTIDKKFNKEWGPQFATAGANIGIAFANGLRDSISDVVAAAKEMAKALEPYLKGHSPTEKGPLSSIDTWWKGLAPALVSGLNTDLIGASISKAVTPPSIGVAAGGGGGGDVIINVTVEGNAVYSRDLADEIRTQLLLNGRRNLNVGLA